MPRFRKKPVVIEAMEWDGSAERYREIVEWSRTAQGLVGGGLLIPTLEGEMMASVGDWVIRGVNGEFYPCKPDIFAKTYDLVVDVEPLNVALARDDGFADKLIQQLAEGDIQVDPTTGEVIDRTFLVTFAVAAIDLNDATEQAESYLDGADFNIVTPAVGTINTIAIAPRVDDTCDTCDTCDQPATRHVCHRHAG